MFFHCSDLFQKASSGENRRKTDSKITMTIGIQFGETCQIPMCLRHDVMDLSKQYSADGLSFILITVEALVSDHLGNSEKWSQLEMVAYKKQPHDETIESGHL